jgi:hypothetical protein
MLDRTAPAAPWGEAQADSIAPRYPESRDAYRALASPDAHTRVIECRDGIQWIVQRLKLVNGVRQWRGVSYCRTREALLRCVREWVPGEHAALEALPNRFPRSLVFTKS